MKKTAAEAEILLQLFQQNRIPIGMIKKHDHIPDQVVVQMPGLPEEALVQVAQFLDKKKRPPFSDQGHGAFFFARNPLKNRCRSKMV